jgi:hypothetical protein
MKLIIPISKLLKDDVILGIASLAENPFPKKRIIIESVEMKGEIAKVKYLHEGRIETAELSGKVMAEILR